MSVVTAVIVQARMGSTRLPGKVLKTLAGRSVLARVLERCSTIPGIDVVCCATSDLSADDIVADTALCCGVEVFRGSESDVLGRYAGAARALGADVVLRVTADCPLIDPQVCGAVVALRAERNADFACNNMPPSWPHGLDCEVFTTDWLNRADREASASEEREHVGPYIRRHAEVTKANLRCPESGVASLRWTLDTSADFAFMEALFARLPEGPSAWSWKVPLEIVRLDGALAEMCHSVDRAHA